MKLRKTLYFFLLCLFNFSCESVDKKSEFIGIWESTNDFTGKTVLSFYKDSIITEGFGGGFRTSSEWSVDSTKLYLKNIRQFYPYINTDSVIKISLDYEYRLNPTKDSLMITVVQEDTIYSVSFIQVDKNPFAQTNPFNN
ncbi:hypothetical protein [Constantimarinum furrinae]|uniref:Uncharacterized protein n=1 Tax=Constantimarinum furrinae TaxID=2562285 RepID=A0A7G8PUY2_9FLAO|nr:hypothetical protein [Constantimarinum furrinae]QNJ98148.1 hypothetical protein ALE3EI_1591 [Constantimarinum furrinae]